MDEVGVKEKTKQNESKPKEKESLWKRLFGINGKNGRNGKGEDDVYKRTGFKKGVEDAGIKSANARRDAIGEDLIKKTQNLDGTGVTESTGGSTSTADERMYGNLDARLQGRRRKRQKGSTG